MNIQPTGASLPPPASAAGTVATGEFRATRGSMTSNVDAAQLSQSTAASVTEPDRAKLEAATKSVREFVEPINNNLEFSVDHDTGQLVVKIIDSATKEVIRQVLSAHMLSLAKALDSIKGLFVKQTA